MKKKDGHSFNFVLAPPDKAKLLAMAAAADCSLTQIIREAVRTKYAMEIQKIPTCSNGHACFVPHMHPDHAQLTTPPQGPPHAIPARS